MSNRFHYKADGNGNDNGGDNDNDNDNQQNQNLIHNNDHDNDNENDNNEDNHPPLDTRVIEIIRTSKRTTTGTSNSDDDDNDNDNEYYYTIRPAKLASELGMSIDDASSELCGLLQAVGPSASFHFESIPTTTAATAATTKTTTVMVFKFPQDFEQKAYKTRNQETRNIIYWNIIYTIIQILKIIVAFGLIISFAVVLIGGICIILGMIVALSRGGGNGSHTNGHRHTHGFGQRRLLGISRNMFSSLRELLWLFSLGRGFDYVDGGGNGNGNGNGVDPFLAETIYSFGYWGGPSNICFWLRMYRMRHRWERRNRGWGGAGGIGAGSTTGTNSMSGVRNRGTWNNRDDATINATTTTTTTTTGILRNRSNSNPGRSANGSNGSNNTRQNQHHTQDHKGLLSVVVEFLFGPSPFMPGPNEYQKWKLREQFIMYMSTNNGNSNESGGNISLPQFLPFVNYPPPPSSPSPSPFITTNVREEEHEQSISNSNLQEQQRLWSSSSIDSGGTSNTCYYTQMRSECLSIVTHFNGVPFIPQMKRKSFQPPATTANDATTNTTTTTTTTTTTDAHFIFPELMLLSESDTTTGSLSSSDEHTHENENGDDGGGVDSRYSFLYTSSAQEAWNTAGHALGGGSTAVATTAVSSTSSTTPTPTPKKPTYLHEKRHVLTKLTKSQFQTCILLNIINYIGLLILWKSIHEGGVLEIRDRNNSSALYMIIKSIILLLVFYAKLFFVLPLGRMVVIFILNRNIDIRNTRRKLFAKVLN